jgi:hypothetical protein
VTSVTINPRGTRQLRVTPTAAGTCNVVFYPASQPENPRVQNHTANAGYRGRFDAPGAGVLVVAQ